MSMSDVRQLLERIAEQAARIDALEGEVARLRDRVDGKDMMDEVLGPAAAPKKGKAA